MYTVAQILKKIEAEYLEKDPECWKIYRTLYPQKPILRDIDFLFIKFHIVRIGYDETLSIAEWAARKAYVKDGRLRLWEHVCNKKYKELHPEQKEGKQDDIPTER